MVEGKDKKKFANKHWSIVICEIVLEIKYIFFSRAPFRARINPSHFGADINILLVKLFYHIYFGAGQKNNPSHGPVAQVTMAPMLHHTLVDTEIVT